MIPTPEDWADWGAADPPVATHGRWAVFASGAVHLWHEHDASWVATMGGEGLEVTRRCLHCGVEVG